MYLNLRSVCCSIKEGLQGFLRHFFLRKVKLWRLGAEDEAKVSGKQVIFGSEGADD